MLFLIYGPDEYGRSEALAALKARVPVEVADLNMTTLDGRRATLETWRRHARQCHSLPTGGWSLSTIC